MKLVTTLLDALGLLLVATGATFGAAHWLGLGPATGIGGVVVLTGSYLAARQAEPRKPSGDRQ